ncbi:MAG: ATP-binding cassette domain-containing protein [Alphaproteobacteria bacterium]|nr:ATP-binding cassette domain-containing protein [Alphaproteobacteria bacterium]
MSGAGEVLLEARDLRRRFGHFTAVDGVSLTLRRGELHALIGPNGAGKTTLVDLLSGARRAEPGGAVRLLGRDVTGFGSWRVSRAGLGRSFQRARLFREMSALENVLLAVRGRCFGRGFDIGDGGAAARDAARSALREAGLDARANDLVFEFSQGERRLLELAMGVAGGAGLILLDEPLAGLGAGESRAMCERVRGLGAARAVLMIEHDLDAVFRLADRVTVMAGGVVVASGSPDEVQGDAAVREAYMPAGSGVDGDGDGADDENGAERSSALVGEASLTVNGDGRSVALVGEASVTSHDVGSSERYPLMPAGAARKKLNGENLLTLKGVSAGYGALRVIPGMDLTIAKGECVALLGRNGMGKTTLLKVIAGWLGLKDGERRWQGGDVSGLSAREMSGLGVMLLPEDRGVFANLSVLENLTLSARSEGWSLERVLSVFPELGGRLRNPGDSLSGGERQILNIARALMTGPRLLLLDETTEGLSPRVAERVWGVLGSLREEGYGMVVVDKNWERAALLADRVVVLLKGGIVYEAAGADFLGEREVAQRYLGI